MTTAKQIKQFIRDTENKVLIAGYGSLLSQYSRQTYSKIVSTSLPVEVGGWKRAWITRSLSEQQTYAGAVPCRHSRISAQLIPLAFDESFTEREKDYRFTRLRNEDITLLGALERNKHSVESHEGNIDTTDNANNQQALREVLDRVPIYICETLDIQESNESFPVNYSYINTCLQGAYETQQDAGVDAFFAHTQGWQSGVFYDDSAKVRYPRSTPAKTPPWNTTTLIAKYAKK